MSSVIQTTTPRVKQLQQIPFRTPLDTPFARERARVGTQFEPCEPPDDEARQDERDEDEDAANR